MAGRIQYLHIQKGGHIKMTSRSDTTDSLPQLAHKKSLSPVPCLRKRHHNTLSCGAKSKSPKNVDFVDSAKGKPLTEVFLILEKVDRTPMKKAVHCCNAF